MKATLVFSLRQRIAGLGHLDNQLGEIRYSLNAARLEIESLLSKVEKMPDDPPHEPTMKPTLCLYKHNDGQSYWYEALIPCGDNEALAAQGPRIIFLNTKAGLEHIIAPTGRLSAGWVIGLIKEGV